MVAQADTGVACPEGSLTGFRRTAGQAAARSPAASAGARTPPGVLSGRDSLRKALAIRHDARDGYGEAVTEAALGDAYLDLDDFAEAINHYQRALARYRTTRSPVLEQHAEVRRVEHAFRAAAPGELHIAGQRRDNRSRRRTRCRGWPSCPPGWAAHEPASPSRKASGKIVNNDGIAVKNAGQATRPTVNSRCIAGQEDHQPAQETAGQGL